MFPLFIKGILVSPIKIDLLVWGISSSGRAPALHAGGTGINTRILHFCTILKSTEIPHTPKICYNSRQLKTKERPVFQNSTTPKERHHSKEMVLLNCKTVQPIHDNIRYTDLKAPMGFEPMTSCLLDRCSNHLSYGAKLRLSARKCSRDTGAATTS